jgi:hypothetical protein
VAVIAGAVPAGIAGADSFTPVRMAIAVTPVARLHKPLAVTVRVTADPGALDTRTGPVWIGVKLAGECGATFQYTNGVALLDKQLNPQPAAGRPYSALAHGSGRPTAYGTEVLCTFLEDRGDDRVFANDESVTTNVSKRCTVAAARYDAFRRAHTSKSRVAAARRAARRACGPGVPL